MITTTIWVIQCLNPDSEHYECFYIGSGVVDKEYLAHAQTYSTIEGATKRARTLNKDGTLGHFETQGWTPVGCQLTLGIPE